KILELPEHLINTNCEIWGNLIDGALPNSNILKEKSDFLNALQQVTNGGADSQKDVRDAARAYSSKLAEIINPKARFHGNNVKVFASTVLVIASAYT
ncbi:MAG: hypothetical protein GTO02_01795, partial [Candidatus Dadabacteria bacterium]|nr:hypothetical protein [Candidatus Dadabacteria bacterium]